MASETALLEVGVLFATVGAVGLVATRLGQSVIPFYIVSGILLSGYVAGDLSQQYLGVEAAVGADESVQAFVEIGAELGIVLLLFFLGLEFNLERLFANSDRIGAAGLVDLVGNFGVGLLLGWLVFGSFVPAFAFAGMVYISSSAIITKSLIDQGWIANDEAEPMLGILVFEDLFIAVYLAVLTALVVGGGDAGAAAGQIGVALALIVVLLAVAHYGTPLFERLLQTDSNEFVVLRTLGVTVLIAGAALALGVSEAVAAFFVGMAFSSTAYVTEVEDLLEPVRDGFAAIFFFWIGMETDPGVLVGGTVLALTVVAVLLTTPTKLVTGFVGGRIYDLSDRRSVRVALGMTTRGEFTLIIASVLLVEGAGDVLGSGTVDTLNAFAVGYVLVMSILGTTLMQYSSPFERFVTARTGGA